MYHFSLAFNNLNVVYSKNLREMRQCMHATHYQDNNSFSCRIGNMLNGEKGTKGLPFMLWRDQTTMTVLWDNELADLQKGAVSSVSNMSSDWNFETSMYRTRMFFYVCRQTYPRQ